MSVKLGAAIGFAARAGKLACGDFAVTKAVKSSKAKLVVIDENASPATVSKWENSCKFYSVKLVKTASPGKFAGKDAGIVFAVLDDGFAKLICEAHNTQSDSNMQN